MTIVIWRCPEIGVPTKWIVYHGKPYFFMDYLGYPIHGNLHIPHKNR
jgi:hypothetical protein